MLHDEQPDVYIARCRGAVQFQRNYINALREAYGRHNYECYLTSNDCVLCESYLEVIMQNEQLLDGFNARLNKARKGIYV